MVIPPWSVVDATSFEAVAEETRGLRAKRWVRGPDDATWLRKSPRVSRPNEPAIECLAANLAAAVGLIAPETHCCTWDGERGVLVRGFGDADEELVEGSALLARAIPGYEPRNHAAARRHP